MKRPGHRFEAQVIASCPPWAWARKVPDRAKRPTRCRCGGRIMAACVTCRKPQPDPARFTSPNPWDIEVRWEGRNIRPVAVPAQRYELLLECKSTAAKSLRWDAVKPGDLARAAEHGALAGVLWEYRAEPQHVCHYLPIGTWLDLAAESARASCPIALAAAYGTRVGVDDSRGRVHTYYKLGDLMRRLAGVEVAP